MQTICGVRQRTVNFNLIFLKLFNSLWNFYMFVGYCKWYDGKLPLSTEEMESGVWCMMK